MQKSGYPKKIEELYACLLKRGITNWTVPIMEGDSILEWNNPEISRPSRVEKANLTTEDRDKARRMLIAKYYIEMLSPFDKVVMEKLNITMEDISAKI